MLAVLKYSCASRPDLEPLATGLRATGKPEKNRIFSVFFSVILELFVQAVGQRYQIE
jgi:hypothetical protein